MKVVKPFTAAFSAFKSNIPNINSECSYVKSWLTLQVKNIEESSSFSLKEMKEYEDLKVKVRPENMTYNEGLKYVVANQEINLYKSKKKFLKCYIPGASFCWTFGSIEFGLLLSTGPHSSFIEFFTYTGMPVFFLAYVKIYLFALLITNF